MTVVGYRDDGTLQTVDVQDPSIGPAISTVDYATFQSSYLGSGRWTHTYYTQP